MSCIRFKTLVLEITIQMCWYSPVAGIIGSSSMEEGWGVADTQYVTNFSSASTVRLLSWQVNVLYCNTIWKAATFNDKLYHITLCKLWLVRRVLVGCMFSIFSAKQAQVFLPHRVSLGLATWPVASAWLLVKDMRVVLILQSSLQQEPQRLSPDFKRIYSTPLPE